MNPAYALVYCESETVNKSFVLSKSKIKWVNAVDEEKKKKGFVAKDLVKIQINDTEVEGIIVQTSSKC